MKVLDTDFLIALLRGDKKTIPLMEKLSVGNYTTTAINVFEVLIGAYRARTDQHTRERVKNLVKNLDVLDLDKEVADQAAKIQAELMGRGELLEARDVLMAAIASKYNAAVVTRNIKHFSRIGTVSVEQW